MENLHRAKAVSLTPWKLKMKKVRGEAEAEAAAGTAAAVHAVAELANQI